MISSATTRNADSPGWTSAQPGKILSTPTPPAPGGRERIPYEIT